ncbi:hypothetical protein ACFLYI_00970 [Chloroflexota bacterium]
MSPTFCPVLALASATRAWRESYTAQFLLIVYNYSSAKKSQIVQRHVSRLLP